jgi:hypothetical protein
MSLNRFDQGKRSTFRLLIGLRVAARLVFGILLPVTLAAQESAGPVPRVGLAELGGTPGASLMMPLYFTPDTSKPLRSLELDIEYISNNLKFQKASPGIAAEQVSANIQTSVTEGAPEANGLVRSKLHLKATLPDETAKDGLPDGLLAYLLFQISLDAKPFSLRLTPTVVSAEDASTPPQKVANVATEPGLVSIEVLDVMPEATCFFFSH